MEKLNPTNERLTGNDRYEGFVVDLATEIASIVGFNFSIEVTDGYGSIDKETGEWNGMIRELLEEVRAIKTRLHYAIHPHVCTGLRRGGGLKFEVELIGKLCANEFC